MAANKPFTEKHRLTSYAAIFSRRSFLSLLQNQDYSAINHSIKKYDDDLLGDRFLTYQEYLIFIYNKLKRSYRNEYFYKNTIISDILIKEFGLNESLVISEFKVGNSIADLAMFNGESRAFEVKTTLDTKSRLPTQLSDYKKLFQKNYLVISEDERHLYQGIDKGLGLIYLVRTPRSYKMELTRESEFSIEIDYKTLMRTIRAEEYKAIIKNWYGELPEMTSFQQYAICENLMREIPQDELSTLFLEQMKCRKSNTPLIKSFRKELRQIALALKLNEKQYELLQLNLSKPISI